MSGLREPAARADRPEGGRRARPAGPRHTAGTATRTAPRHTAARPAPAGAPRQIRPQLVRAAVLPTVAAGLIGAAAVLFTLQLDGLRLGGGGAGGAGAVGGGAAADGRLWLVLSGCAVLFAGALAAAWLGAHRAARTVRDRCEALRRSSARGQQELRTVLDRLERGESVPPRRSGGTVLPEGPAPAGVDEFWLLGQELRQAREQAHAALVRTAAIGGHSDSDQKVEVFTNLARRLQSLVHREIQLLDGLEDIVEDPDLLKELFHVDHLATRIRRHAENLAVLGGSASRRQWTRPIDISEVLRSSVAEVEQYTRVKVVPPAGGSVRGHAVADVVHLLAELVENATVFSPPDTDVLLRAERVTAGIAIEVEDRGLGMPSDEQHRMNSLLGDPDRISVRHLLADGRIGLFVVSALARRHGIAVELKTNIYGGVVAVLVLPRDLLGAEPEETADRFGGSSASAGPAAPAPGAGAAPASGSFGEPGAAGPTVAGTGAGTGLPPLEPARAHDAAVRTPPRAEPAPVPAADTSPVPAPASAGAPAPAGTAARAHAPAPAPAATPAARVRAYAEPGVGVRAHAERAATVPVQLDAARAEPERAGVAHVPAWAADSRSAAPSTEPSAEPSAGPAAAPARPPLPRRRAQQHVVPQLRDAPAPAAVRPADDTEQPVPDAGLMAAFRRGFGLAQATAVEMAADPVRGGSADPGAEAP
ncbi:sensor histidine kinase KdpD [Streptomyces sp. NRRL S-87]|uniref:sensor histidine kinase n=1 Tax=Streptomyces sp. NRRL S-87 TaxID=1463920 RepID=UPI0007C54952|nr:ATP-binding protein [Streptomyces sp. NRRL S-87]